MNKIKLQSMCMLSFLMLSQVGVSANALESTKSASVQVDSEASDKKDSDTKTSLSLEDDKNTQTPSASISQEKNGETVHSSKENSTTSKITGAAKSHVSPTSGTPTDKGTWGTSPWSFEDYTGTLTIEAGSLAGYQESPWNRTDSSKIDAIKIKKIVLDGEVIAPQNSSYLFKGLGNVGTIENISNLNTSQATTMEGMFNGVSELTSLDLSHFDTSQVTTMASMFYSASGLTSLDLSHFDTSQVTTMESMFYSASGLTSLDLSHFDTSQVTTMNNMFHNASGLTNLNLSSFDTSQVTTMNNMFNGVSGLTSLDLSKFDTSQVTAMNNMFHNASGLTSLDLSKFDTSQVTIMLTMFSGTSGLTSLDLSHFDTSQVTIMEGMFNGASGLTSLDLSGFDTSKVTNMLNMFSLTKNLLSLKLGDRFRFLQNSVASLGIPAVIEGSTGTGKWIREDGKSKGYTPVDFMNNYGQGDLTAGTYVGEVEKKATLSLSTYTDKEKYTIGDKINTTIVIKHTLDSEKGSEAKNITLSDLTKFTLESSQSLPSQVTVETYDSTDQKTDSKEEDISEALSLPDLKQGSYYKIVVSGEAINNTNPSVDSNYNLKLSYSQAESQNNIATSIDQNIEIDSGDLKFSSVPDQLEFVKTPFSIDLNNKLINRSDADWQLKVSDLRGTVAYGGDNKVDRQNWNVYASAEAFKDEGGAAVSDGALSTTFVQGDKQTDLSSDETLIASHDVKDETPKDNSETSIKWGETEGIKAVVHDRSKLDSNKKYSSDMTFEIRIEP